MALKGKRGIDEKECGHRSIDLSVQVVEEQSRWASLPPDLLLDIIVRVEANQRVWPARRSVVCCAAVCKSRRGIVREVVWTPEQCGLLTFPMSLKQPGPRDSPIQCFIRRERATSTYRLYLGLTPAISGEASKFLLAARRIKRATKTDFVISFAANDFSHTSDCHAGKLRSNFFGSKFYVHDSRPPCNTPIQSHRWLGKRISPKKVAPRIPICSFNVATIAYQLNVFRTRGPRRMNCTMHIIPISSTEEGGSVTFGCGHDEAFSPLTATEMRKQDSASDVPIRGKSKQPYNSIGEPLILKNKTPRWHEQLQCWCLNFRGRVTVASVKNFQLVAAGESSENVPASEQENVILGRRVILIVVVLGSSSGFESFGSEDAGSFLPS
ncbi:tubby-like F-box protein 5 [Salvia hispanica]|uniref:tubby-like F-box protein 5 n=1 Tax=Salvia hispanica TaxID=49212 RepID=UPI002009D8E8|nr:tubby-like F-box protein 5 [Salvia hispanica]